MMERIAEKKAAAVVLKVRRGIRTLFVELQSAGQRRQWRR